MKEALTRAELVAEVLRLRADGLTAKHVAQRLNLKVGTVRIIFSDPDGSKQRERRKRYQGICIECGGPTDGSNGAANQSLRCRYCVSGTHAQRPPDRRRRVPVRLTEIPLERRLAAAHDACRIEKGDIERTEILFAAITPSDLVYWVAA